LNTKAPENGQHKRLGQLAYDSVIEPAEDFERARLRCDLYYYRQCSADQAGQSALLRAERLKLLAEIRSLRRHNAELRRQLATRLKVAL